MEERDRPSAPGAAAVDQLDAVDLEAGQGLAVRVVDLEADVVEALALALEEAGDAGRVVRRLDELDLRLADRQEGDPDPVDWGWSWIVSRAAERRASSRAASISATTTTATWSADRRPWRARGRASSSLPEGSMSAGCHIRRGGSPRRSSRKRATPVVSSVGSTAVWLADARNAMRRGRGRSSRASLGRASGRRRPVAGDHRDVVLPRRGGIRGPSGWRARLRSGRRPAPDRVRSARPRS